MKIVENADLTSHTTLRIVSSAQKLAKPTSIDELRELFNYIKEQKLAWHILGAGSNLLISSRAIHGIVICMTGLDFVKKLSDTQVEVGAGLRMPRFCAMMAKESLAGTEWMEGIPGTIGGGVVMNAGAHGSEIAANLVSAKVFDTETWEIKDISNEDLKFTYRRSKINPEKEIVVSAVFELEAAEKQEIRNRISEYNKARSTHQPIKAATCGCTFKNPDEHRAGLLIQEIGAKGLQEGSVQVSMKHGNFFENTNGGTSMDFCKLMARIQEMAYEQQGIILHPEVKRMGEFSDEELLVWNPEKKLLATNI